MGRRKKNQSNQRLRTFEECIDTINECINKRRHRWTLSALAFLDFEDVAQNLRFHIFKKWHLYDQTKKIESWLTVVINNQMINMIRNYYGNFSRPCLKCEFYEGDDICKKFDVVSTKCDLYRTWTYGKKTKHDIQLSLPIENYINEIQEIPTQELNIDKASIQLHDKMRSILTDLEYKVYDLLFIQHKSEEEVGKLLKYKTSEKNRNPGYKQVKNISKRIVRKAREILNNEEIEII